MRVIIKHALSNPESSIVSITVLDTNTSLDESQDLEVERAVQTLGRRQCLC